MHSMMIGRVCCLRHSGTGSVVLFVLLKQWYHLLCCAHQSQFKWATWSIQLQCSGLQSTEKTHNGDLFYAKEIKLRLGTKMHIQYHTTGLSHTLSFFSPQKNFFFVFQGS